MNEILEILLTSDSLIIALLTLILLSLIFLARLTMDQISHQRKTFAFFADWANQVTEKLYEESPNKNNFLNTDPTFLDMQNEFENKVKEKSKK